MHSVGPPDLGERDLSRSWSSLQFTAGSAQDKMRLLRALPIQIFNLSWDGDWADTLRNLDEMLDWTSLSRPKNQSIDFRDSDSFTICSGVCLVTGNVLQKKEAKKRPRKEYLNVAQNQWQWVSSLWIRTKDQVHFLWTTLSKAWCPKFSLPLHHWNKVFLLLHVWENKGWFLLLT